MGLVPDVVLTACKRKEAGDIRRATLLSDECMIWLASRMHSWGSHIVSDGSGHSLTAMVDVWRVGRSDNANDVTVSLKATEWCSFLQRLAICVIQDDDKVIPDDELRKVRCVVHLHVVVVHRWRA